VSLRYGSVCSGIEAATVAWHPLGWQPQFFSEIEAAPRAVLQHRYPQVPLHGDFTTIREGEYGAIDLLVGGTPCQSFSVAGLRGGLADDRGNLALEYLRLAQRLRPRWLVWENVPGVLSSNGGRDFGAILGGMVELGYGFAYRVLDAQYVRTHGYGRAVPQRRRRVFVVGHLGDWRRPAAVLFERASLRGDPAPRREAGQGIAASLTSSLGRRCGVPDGGDTDGHLIAGTLCSSHGNTRAELAWTGQLIAGTVSSKWAKGTGGPAGDECQNLVAFDTTQITSASNYSRPRPGDPCHPLSAGMHAPAIAWSVTQDSTPLFERELSPSLKIGTGLDLGQPPCVSNGWSVRRLTPRECERLQGFPDDHTLVPWRGGLMPDGPRYKALGNSMACNVMRWLGRRIEAVEAVCSLAKAAA
jgi:DNA (cytosine-5)-methyltransferase 1